MKYDERTCKVNMDTGCVELRLRDGRMISIDCTGVEDELDVTMAQRTELDYLILQNPMTCFDPLYRIVQQIAETFSAHNNWTAEEIHVRSLELLEKMRIRNPEEVLEKYPHQLSGGMLQRIMIGIATAMKPALLIADEPTTAIDAITQYEILNELLHIKENHNTAIIFISHDLNAISRVADRIVVLNHGAVVDRGDFQHILHHAQDPYTKLLVEKRADVMRRYTAVLNGKKETAHA